VITTSADALGMPSLDLLGRRDGWIVESGDLTHVSATLINGECVRVYQDAGSEDWWRTVPENVERVSLPSELHNGEAGASMVISDRLLSVRPALSSSAKTVVVGIGCARGTPIGDLRDLVLGTLARHHISPRGVGKVASITLKNNEPAIGNTQGSYAATYATSRMSSFDRRRAESLIPSACRGGVS